MAACSVKQQAPVEGKARKPRTTNPGVRVQGGRIYDSETGTTCHQCRQKTVELKGKCTQCTLYWCPRCLLNRYGEEVSQVTSKSEWPCPRCRGLCNCSNCRKKQGMEATGILSHMCKAAGIASVSVLLEKNPKAKRPASASLPNPEAAKAPKKIKGPPQSKATDDPFMRSASDDASAIASQEAAAAAHASCSQPRPPLPAKEALTLPAEAKAAAPAASRARQRGKTAAKGRTAEMEAQPAASQRRPLPPGCSAGDLIEVLEFLQTFASDLSVSLPKDLGPFASELLQSASTRRELRGESSSCVAQVHACLLKKMREAAGLRSSAPFWQEGMREYLVTQQEQHDSQQQQEQHDSQQQQQHAVVQDGTPSQDDRDAQLRDAFDRQGYWSLPPALRLSMLGMLCHDLLQTHIIREAVDRAMEEQDRGVKEQRTEAAAARKEARAKLQRARDREIAAILSGNTSKAMTLEEQRQVMAASQQRLTTAMSASQHEPACLQHTTASAKVRRLPLGQDREGSAYWQLSCAAHVSGQSGALLMSSSYNPGHEQVIDHGDQAADMWHVLPAPESLIAALDPSLEEEARLRIALSSSLGIAV